MIALGSDHGGYKLKEEIKRYFDEVGIEYEDFGTHSEERTDYPLYAAKVAEAVQNKDCDNGIVICKTGFGVSIVANKYEGIRCAPCYDEESAKLAKEHLDINVLALPANTLSISKVVGIIRIWLGANFLEGRYRERLQMIEEIEKNNMK